ncbi:hypothetical protein BDV93DRAFT_517163, partial [Ceratobasidium sp. AG-I]
MPLNDKPLLGDSDGRFKIAIVGNSGTGKSTLAAELSKLLGVPHLPLDEVYWNPGWVETPAEDFKAHVKTFLDSHPDGWIVDGNYLRKMGPIAQDAATDVLWLDPPLILTFWRVLVRTFRRLFLGEQPCAVGCNENITETLGSRKSILLWCLTQHNVIRRDYTAKWDSESAEGGRGKWRRFGGWGSSLSEWVDCLSSSIKS